MNIATLIVFIVYLVGMLAIGITMYYRTHDLSDYVLGGRGLGPATAALSAGASEMSGFLVLGVPGAIYASGFAEAWIAIGLSIGAFLNWQLIAKRLRVYTEVAEDSITIPDFLESRFKDTSRLLRIISAVVTLIFFTFYTSSGMVAGAILFESSFGLSYMTALIIGTIVIVAYTFLGGFMAVVWTDFIQGSLMLLVLILVPIVGFTQMGGWNETVQAVGTIDPGHLNMLKGVGAIAIISALAWGLGYFGQPHILVRFMALKDKKDVPVARFIGMTWMILGMFGAIFVGFIGLAFINSQDPSAHSSFGIDFKTEDGVNLLGDPETILIAFSEILFHPIIAGVILAAILSAIMSTVDSQLLVSSSAIAEDFYKGLFRKNASDNELVWVGRIATIAIALIAAIIAINPDSTVLDLVSYAWAGFGASFGPIILLALFWRGITRNGALAGIIVGAATVIIWGDFLSGGIFDLYEIVPGFILNLVVAVIVSLMGKEDPEVQAEFDEAVAKLDE